MELARKEKSNCPVTFTIVLRKTKRERDREREGEREGGREREREREKERELRYLEEEESHFDRSLPL